MGPKINCKNVIQLLAALLALAFVISGVLYLLGTIDGTLEELSRSGEKGIRKAFDAISSFGFPILLILSMLVLAIYIFIPGTKSKNAWLVAATFIFMAAFLIPSVEGLYIGIANDFAYSDATPFTPCFIMLVTYIPIAICAIKKKKHWSTLVFSVIALGVCVYSALSDDSLFTPIFVNWFNAWTEFFVPAIIVVPFALGMVHNTAYEKAQSAEKAAAQPAETREA